MVVVMGALTEIQNKGENAACTDVGGGGGGKFKFDF